MIIDVPIAHQSEPPVTLDPTLPLFRAAWSEIARHLLLTGQRWLHEAMPVDLQSRAPGSLRNRLSEANGVLGAVARVAGLDLSAWGIVAWSPERFAATNTIVLVAVGPDGIAHDITALADGRDDPTKKALVAQ